MVSRLCLFCLHFFQYLFYCYYCCSFVFILSFYYCCWFKTEIFVQIGRTLKNCIVVVLLVSGVNVTNCHRLINIVVAFVLVKTMLISTMKVVVALILSFMFTVSLVKLVLLFWHEYPTLLLYGFSSDPTLPTIDEWLEQNNLTDYKQLFRDKGKRSTMIIFLFHLFTVHNEFFMRKVLNLFFFF